METKKGLLKSPKFSRLRYRFFIYLVFFVLILAQAIWFFPTLSKIKENAAFQQLEIANRARDETIGFVNNNFDEIERILGMISAVGNKEFYINLIMKNQDITQATLIDKNGQETFKIHRSRRILPEELTDRTGDNGVRQALQNGTRYVGPVFTENLEPMISLIMPIKSSEAEINGAMEVYLNLRSIWSTIGNLKVGQNGQVYIVNSNGIIIAHKDPLIVLSGQYVLDKEIVKKLITDKQTVDGLGPESDYINNGVEVFGVGVPIEDFNWGVIVEQPWQDALAARTNIILLAGISLGMGLGLLILIQLTINQLLKASASLEIEKQKAEELSRDLEEKVYTRTAELNQEKASLEIKVLDRTKQLQEKVKELEKATEQLENEKQKQHELSQALEIKVKARTAELNEEKAGLETKIADRTREMQEKVQELERFQKFVVGRELKMVELKQEIRKLQEEIDKN